MILIKRKGGYMSLKYAKKSQLITYTILAAIKACNIVFVAYMIEIMLNVAAITCI